MNSLLLCALVGSAALGAAASDELGPRDFDVTFDGVSNVDYHAGPSHDIAGEGLPETEGASLEDRRLSKKKGYGYGMHESSSSDDAGMQQQQKQIVVLAPNVNAVRTEYENLYNAHPPRNYDYYPVTTGPYGRFLKKKKFAYQTPVVVLSGKGGSFAKPKKGAGVPVAPVHHVDHTPLHDDSIDSYHVEIDEPTAFFAKGGKKAFTKPAPIPKKRPVPVAFEPLEDSTDSFEDHYYGFPGKTGYERHLSKAKPKKKGGKKAGAVSKSFYKPVKTQKVALSTPTFTKVSKKTTKAFPGKKGFSGPVIHDSFVPAGKKGKATAKPAFNAKAGKKVKVAPVPTKAVYHTVEHESFSHSDDVTFTPKKGVAAAHY